MRFSTSPRRPGELVLNGVGEMLGGLCPGTVFHADPLHIALVLKPEWRTPGGIARARGIAVTLGIEITGVGDAAVSGTLSPALYDVLFGAGAAEGDHYSAEPLRELIESVSIIPRLPAR